MDRSNKHALILASVASMIDYFNMPNIEILLDLGYSVDVACNFEYGNTCSDEKIAELKARLQEKGVSYYQIDFTRKVSNLSQDYKAYKQVKKLVDDNKYDFIHCHSPIGGVIGRIVAHKTGTKVIYTAHGFHFFDGAPLKNWLVFYPIEKHFSRYTDVLITINKEDYKRAKEKFKAKKTVYIPGVGIDTAKFAPSISAREKIRAELGLDDDRTLLLSVGELNANKNHSSVIKAIAGIENITYVIVGQGQLKDNLSRLAAESHVDLRLMGFRNDVADFYDAADIYILPSLREGLNVSLMEAMASSLPCLAGDIRGNVDLIDEQGGMLFEPSSVEDIKAVIAKELGLGKDERQVQGHHNTDIIRSFDMSKVDNIAEKIYGGVIGT